ncbi:MAG: hypothetical protein RIA69_02245 [Cyclobacteriaceae bacterium]
MKKVLLSFVNFFKSIFSAIFSVFAFIFNGLVSLVKLIFSLFVAIYRGIVGFFKLIYNGIASMYRAFITFFKPKYSVIVSMYHVIPGRPVQRFEHKHEFGKGEIDAARKFYNQVIKKHSETGFPNTEIILVKGKKSFLHTKHFGPVTMVKSMNVA